MKLFVQSQPEVWSTSASLAASGSTTSGSFYTEGYARLVGICIANASAKTASGLTIRQSSNYGLTYDYVTACAPTACSGSAYSIELVGNAAKIDYITDSAASLFRTSWRLRPI